MAIEHFTLAENGHLLITFSDGSVMDAGNVRGPAGPQGEKGVGVKGDPGEPGKDGSGVVVNPNAPSNPKQGDLWYDTDDGNTYLYTGSMWVDSNPSTPGPEGPQGPAGIGVKGFASGYVNAGTFVTLDNIKATVPTSGSRGLSLAAVSGTFTCSVSGHYMYSYAAPSGTASTYPGATYSTTPSGSLFGWGFGNAGDTSVYYLNDYNNQRFYRITLMIGASYNNNFISIERLI
jgi:hypothetical protein